ncbi:hypothetical protein ACGFNU_31480 [Spirillospora sp. NPDC048911]|uniref:hypothetical protein n=1 Tax=Spirillospora sp. NPDC048911 TaxID=3364527 RepID=UPI0037192108
MTQRRPSRWRAWFGRAKRGRAAGDRPGCTVRAAPSPILHLDRLADALARKGLATLPRYADDRPGLRVYLPSAAHIGETIAVDPGGRADEWWYRTSTGILLGTHHDPAAAAETIALLLGRWLPAAWGVIPAREMTVAEVRQRFPGVSCWWGIHTRQWWALIPRGASSRLVSALTPDALARAILKAAGISVRTIHGHPSSNPDVIRSVREGE